MGTFDADTACRAHGQPHPQNHTSRRGQHRGVQGQPDSDARTRAQQPRALLPGAIGDRLRRGLVRRRSQRPCGAQICARWTGHGALRHRGPGQRWPCGRFGISGQVWRTASHCHRPLQPDICAGQAPGHAAARDRCRWFRHHRAARSGLRLRRRWPAACLLRCQTPRDGAADLKVGTAPSPGWADGSGSTARFDGPGALAVGKSGTLYVRDRNNAAIRTIQPDGMVGTLGRVKNPCSQITGPINEVAFCGPEALTVDGAGNIYSYSLKRILKATPAGNVAVFADLSAQLNAIPAFLDLGITGLVADDAGTLYASSLQGVIFKISPAGAVSLFAGNPNARGHADSPAGSALFSALGHMVLDPAGNLYVVDGRYHNITGVGPTIRKITPAGSVSTVAGRADMPPGLVDGPVSSAQLAVDTGAALSDSQA